MSKFCGIISAPTVETKCDPLIYSNFETFVDWLYNVTESMHSDFNTKSNFMQEQQDQSLEHERNIICMNQELKNLNDTVAALEMEVQENNEYLTQLEKVLEILDAKQIEVSKIGTQKDQYETLTNLLESTDNSIQFLRELVEDINEFEQYLQLQINPYNTIASILDCHIEILLQTEKNIDILIDKAVTVEESCRKVQDKINMSNQTASGHAESSTNY